MKSFTRVAAVAVVCLLAVVAAYSVSGPTAAPTTAQSGDRVAVTSAGVSFEVPPGWSTVDRSTLEEAATDGFEGVTALGLSEEEARRLLDQQAELFAWSDEGSITVLVPDQPLPSPEAIESQYRDLGATGIASTEVATEVGQGFSMAFAIAEDAGQTFGQVIALSVDDRSLAIIVLTDDEAGTAAIAEGVLSSLSRG